MRWIVTSLLLLASCAAPGLAQKKQDAPQERVIKLGGLSVHHTRGYLEIDAQVSLDRGLIELFACTPRGKAYESVLVLDCQPVHLMTGLMLLQQKKGHGGRFQGDPTRPRGSTLQALVAWTDPKTGKPRRYHAEDLVWNHRAARPMKRHGWVFTGSHFRKNPNTGKEIFMAQWTGTVMVTYHDPDAIIDTPSKAGDDDTTFYANHRLLPPRGTKLKLLIYPDAIYRKLPAAQQAMPLPPTKQEKK